MALDLTIGNVASKVGIKTPTSNPSGLIGPVPPIGAKAITPVSNTVKPKNTLSLTQTATPSLGAYKYSDSPTVYGNYKGNPDYAFTSEQEFLGAGGDWNKIENRARPTAPSPISTPAGQITQWGNTSAPQGNQTLNLGNTGVPTPPVANPPPTVTTPPPVANLSSPTGPYTPPNQGTTGVSQGGIVGNLIGFAQNESPQVAKARADLKALEEGYGKQTANISGSPIDLSLATGQQGILQRLFAAKQGAAQNALQSALSSQQQQIGATTNAGQLNQPVYNVTPGTAVGQPSQPGGGLVGGTTTSGAQNILSLIGIGNGSNGHPQGEYFNTQTNQGFPTPQALADFVNQQLPIAGATAQNVFQLLNSGSLNNQGGGLVGMNAGGMDFYVQMVLSGQLNQIPASVTGNLALWQQILAKAQQQNPNLNLNQINAQVSTNTGIYDKALNDVQTLNTTLNNIQNLGDMTLTNAAGNNVNPFQFVPGNELLSTAKRLFSSESQSTFDSNISQLKAAISNLYGASGTPTMQADIAGKLSNPNLDMQGLKALVDAAKAEGQVLLNNAKNKAASAYTNISPTNTGTPSFTGGNNGITEGTIAGGGAIIFKNGQWIAN